MNEQIKNKLYESYYWKLHELITYDEFFHVDVELTTNNKTYCLVSTLYAEGGSEVYTDYDQPREFNDPCIVCHAWGLVVLDDEMVPVYYEEEAREIILQAISNYKS